MWTMAETIPWIGPQLAAFGTVAEAVDETVNDGVLPLLSDADDDLLDSLRPQDGRFDLERIEELAGPAKAASDAAGHAASKVAAIDRTNLVGQLSTAVAQVDESASALAGTLDALSRTTHLLPTMLGQDGPRRYIVLVQNNAEWRSLGGIAGTVLQLDTEGGALTLEASVAAAELSKSISDPLATLPDDLRAVYSTLPVSYFQNVTQVPDFAVDGRLAQQMYSQATGVDVDGVIAIDPVVLSYVLEATGPVALSGGEQLTSANAAKLLMSDVYSRFPDAEAQDHFFAQAAGEVFDSVFDGGRSSTALLTALRRGVDERRVLVWSANDDEQRLIDGTSLAGNLPVSDAKTARFGVYLNDATGSKMSYYVEPTVSLAWTDCSAPTAGPRDVTVTLQLRNTAPTDASTSLPRHVTGNGRFGTVPGWAATVTNVYLPEGWTLTSVDTSSAEGVSQATVDGRDVVTVGSLLAPQSDGSFSLTARATTTASMAEALVTPTADAALSPAVRSGCATSAGPTLQ